MRRFPPSVGFPQVDRRIPCKLESRRSNDERKGSAIAMRLWPLRLAIGRRSRRGFVAALLIVNQFVIASGLPLPAVAAAAGEAAKKDLSKPFPCMNRPCGCKNADECWHSCCCFSMREKLAWAKANGVEPPAYVREAAAEEERAEAANAKLHATICGKISSCGCCQKSASRGDDAKCISGCCDRHQPAAAAASRPASDKPVADTAPRAAGKSVILLMALGCQGHSLLSILAKSLPAYVRPIPRRDFIALDSVCILEPSLRSVRFSPPVPPPEIKRSCRS